MTQEEIIRMAQEAGLTFVTEFGVASAPPEWIERFAALIAAAEREACADKTGEFARKWWSIHCASNKHLETTRKAHDDFCALQSAIRARSNP